MGEVTTEAIVEDIRRVAQTLGRRQLSRTEYIQYGSYSRYHLYDGGRTWEGLCTGAGIQTKKIEAVPDEVYFKRLQDAVSSLGRLPKTSETKRFGLNFTKRRWPTLSSFVEAAIERGVFPRPANERATQALVGEKAKAVAETPPRAIAGSRPIPPIPASTKRRKWQRTGIEGFPYAPQDEQGLLLSLQSCAVRGTFHGRP